MAWKFDPMLTETVHMQIQAIKLGEEASAPRRPREKQQALRPGKKEPDALLSHAVYRRRLGDYVKKTGTTLPVEGYLFERLKAATKPTTPVLYIDGFRR